MNKWKLSSGFETFLASLLGPGQIVVKLQVGALPTKLYLSVCQFTAAVPFASA